MEWEHGNKNMFLATAKQAEESCLVWQIQRHQILNMKWKRVTGSGMGMIWFALSRFEGTVYE